MEVFSEIRASISSKIVEQTTSFHQVLEEVEARTKVDIRFTNRSYVFCGSWRQIEKVKQILEDVYCKSPPPASVGAKEYKAEAARRNVTSESDARVGQPEEKPKSDRRPVPESSLSSGRASSVTTETTTSYAPAPGHPTSRSGRSRVISGGGAAAPSEPARDPPAPVSVAPSVEETREDSGEITSPELMMDTDMWDYMAKMNAYELRQLNTQYGVELRPSTTEELTQVKIIPGKGKAVTGDMMESACLTLGNLYQSLFSAVVVETCKVPPDLDDQRICQSAREEVSGMFHNVLVKQNEYDPRVFTFIGAERKSKEARYQFMNLIGMHPTSSRTRGGARGSAYDMMPRHDFYGGDDYTALLPRDADSRGAAGFTPYAEAPRSSSPHYPPYGVTAESHEMSKPVEEETTPTTYNTQQATTQHYSESSSSESDEEDTPIEEIVAQRAIESDRARQVAALERRGQEANLQQRSLSPVQVASLSGRQEAVVIEADAAPMSMPVMSQRTQRKTHADLIDFTDKSPDRNARTRAPEAVKVGHSQRSRPTSDDLTAAKQQAASIDSLDEVTTAVKSVNLSEGGHVSSQRQVSRSPDDVHSFGSKSSSHSSLDRQVSGPPENRQRSGGSSPGSANHYDISFLDSEGADAKQPTSQSSDRSAFSKYGKSGKVMPQQNPFEAKRQMPAAESSRQRPVSSEASRMTQSVYNSGSAETHQKVSYQSMPERASPIRSNTIELCEGCVQMMDTPREMPCTHVFCQECCDIALSKDHICPKCGADWWQMEGTQPEGTLNIVIDKKESLAGYANSGTICVTFMFPAGKQSESSANPGRPYQAFQGNTYLPNNGEGRMLLKQLKKAFDRKLLFRTKASTSAVPDTVDIVGVTLKPEPSGRGGYPDPKYLERLKADLKYRGASFDV